MKRTINVHIVLVLGLGLTLALLWLLGNITPPPATRAADLLHPATAPGDVLCVTPEGGAYVGCTQVFTNVQAAVDAASGGEVIKVTAGVYTGVSYHPSCSIEVLCINKSLTVQGGYTITNWETPDFQNNPTILDAQGQGRALAVGVWNMITLTLDGLQMTNGNAQGLYGDLDSYDAGGGAWFFRATVSMRNCQVSNSYAEVGGGVYAHASDVTFDNVTLLHNVAQYWGGGTYLDKSRANLVSSNFLSNTAQYGGGLFSEESDATLDANIMTSNAATYGGGLYIDYGNSSLNRNMVVANTATNVGGGVYLNTSDAMLTNNVIADNQASTYGSGVYIVRGSPQLAHNTIARNHNGDGSGVYVTGIYRPQYDKYYPATAVLTNTILVSQTVGITVAANNTATVAGVLWFSNQANTGGAGAIFVTHEITGDPAFMPDGYHITAGSAAIDHSVEAGIGNDIESQTRPNGSGYDFGADEFYSNSSLTVMKQVSPDPVQAGAHLTYTLRVTNTGNTNLHATITDTLPAQVTPTGTQTWTAVIAAPGGVWAQVLPVTVAWGYSGTLTNRVEVATQEGATGAYTATSQAQVTPALAVTKQAVPDPVQAGAQLTYTIRITNTGNTDLHTLITDTLPAQVTPTGILTQMTVIAAPGSVWVWSVPVEVAWSYSGTLTNVVEVTTAEGATGIYTETSTVFTPQPDLQVTKQASPDPVRAGSQLIYTLRITNTGNVDLHATITDTLPMHVTSGKTSGGTTLLPGQPFTWTAYIPTSGVWMETVVVTVEMGYSGPLTNVVQVTTDEGATGIYTATSTVFAPQSALQVTKQASPNPVQAGAPLTYTLRVTNTGNVDLHAIITDTLPAHVTPSGILTWIATIPTPGDIWSQTLVVTVEKGYNDTLTNLVQITTAEGAAGAASAIVNVVSYKVYLPVVLRQP